MLFASIRNELIDHIKIYNTISYLFIFFLFLIISMVFVIPKNLILSQGPALLLIIIPIAQLGNLNTIFQNDFKTGVLELQLASINTDYIVMAKYLALNFLSIIAMLAIIPLISFLYSISILNSIKLFITYSLTLLYVNSFSLLIAALQIYFLSACNFILALIFPLIIPIIICAVLSILNTENYKFFISVIIALNLIIVPIVISMVSYLIRNIYNI